MSGAPATSVTVVIPAWNEVGDIEGCLAAVAAQDHVGPLDVIVVDGGSTDGTAEVVREVAARLGLRTQVLENPRRRTSISLDVGLAAATGDVLVRIDARARVAPSYVRRCVEVLAADPAVGVVGGAQVPTARTHRLVDRAIARALRNRYATGFSRYRRAATSGPSDTVWMGTFRTGELRDLGGWSEEVALNEDWELNARYRARGRLVWFLADQRSAYLPRTSYGRLARQHLYFGRVKGMWWVRGMRPTSRQVALVAGPPVAGAALVAAGRRVGPAALVAPAAALVAVDALGCDDPADPLERVASAAAIGVYTASWWAGTVLGVLGELAGVEHQHRTPVPEGSAP